MARTVQPLDVPVLGPAPAGPTHDGKAYYFKITAREDGTFTVTNTRNGFSKTYAPRQQGS